MRKVQSRDAKTIGRKTVAQPVISLVPKKFPSTSRVLTHYKGKTTALDRKKKILVPLQIIRSKLTPLKVRQPDFMSV